MSLHQRLAYSVRVSQLVRLASNHWVTHGHRLALRFRLPLYIRLALNVWISLHQRLAYRERVSHREWLAPLHRVSL